MYYKLIGIAIRVWERERDKKNVFIYFKCKPETSLTHNKFSLLRKKEHSTTEENNNLRYFLLISFYFRTVNFN